MGHISTLENTDNLVRDEEAVQIWSSGNDKGTEIAVEEPERRAPLDGGYGWIIVAGTLQSRLQRPLSDVLIVSL